MAGFLYVGAGGALGAALRYAISLLPYKGLFPALTLITNVLGAAAIGCIAGMAARRGGHEQLGLPGIGYHLPDRGSPRGP